MFRQQWMSRNSGKHGSYSALVLGGLLGISILSSPEVRAEKSTAEAIKRVEDGLASRTVSSIEELAQRLRSEQAVYRMLMPPSAHFTLVLRTG